MMKKTVQYLITLCCILMYHLAFGAEKSGYFSAGGLGAELGIWKPSSLDGNPSKPFKNVKGADPYWGISFVTPSFAGFALRVALIQWQQRLTDETAQLESVTLRHLSLDLKNQIVSQARISPYVCYGLAAIWSREKPVDVGDRKVPLDRAGYGVNVGAGLDVQALKHWAFAVEYQYLYAAFEKKVGLTDNYSGPKVSGRVMFLF